MVHGWGAAAALGKGEEDCGGVSGRRSPTARRVMRRLMKAIRIGDAPADNAAPPAVALETTATATRVMLSVVSHLRHRRSDSDAALTGHAVFKLFDLCHNSNTDFRERQNAAFNLGAADLMISKLDNEQLESRRGIIFRALGQMCFNNEPISAYVGPRVVSRVQAILDSASEEAVLKQEAIYCVQNAAANSWHAHEWLVKLAPVVVRTLNSNRFTHKALCAQCVFYLGVLAYNVDSRPALIAAHSMPALSRIMCSNDSELFPTSATVALACLVQDSENGAQALADAGSDVINQLVQAIEASLVSKPFPEGSEIYFTDWKLMLGVHELSRTPNNKRALLEAGIMPLLWDAAGRSQSPRLVEESLKTIWHLSEDGSKSSNKRQRRALSQ